MAAAPWGELALRLAVASLVGGAIGWDRERSDKPAGLRTHMLVALGAASFAILGLAVATDLGAAADPTRVVQGIVGGVGFMGAGAIIQTRGRVSGITTAASVWIAGSLGAAAGAGAYALVGLTVVFAFVILTGIGQLERRIKARGRHDQRPT